MSFQNDFYDDQVDYTRGSPHLTHRALYESLVVRVLSEWRRVRANVGYGSGVLEAGAGHGGYTEPLLAAGARVTAVEMSAASVAKLTQRFEHNPSFRAELTESGSVDELPTDFDMVLAVAVLHHVPDYISFVTSLADKVKPGGSLVTLQDPMRYSRRLIAHRADRFGYVVWRLFQGGLVRGISTQYRRHFGQLDSSNPSDMVEYHVVRQGVDEAAVIDALRTKFAVVELVEYWSNQSAQMQRVGRRLGLKNTFGVVCRSKVQ